MTTGPDAERPDEQTPLLSGRQSGEEKKPGFASWIVNAINVEHRILLAGFLITLSFSFTQVPIFYAFHLMECDIFYDTHPPFDGPGDRCTRNEIAARTATDFSILGMSTTICGTVNLFVAGWLVKKFGPRAALLLQTLVPALRVATQILGVMAGREPGILIIQLTQLITLAGGPAGYMLVINIIAGEAVEPIRRTAVFGMLQGAFMLGQAIGYYTGGIIGDTWGIQRPFEVAFCSFIISSAFSQATLPYISPESMSGGKGSQAKGVGAFLAPLRVLRPQRIRLADGSTRKHYGVLYLCIGVFIGVVATSYAPLLIQMYATAVFEFNQGDNGYLMSGYSLARALFLLFLFPPIIDWGRKWYMSSYPRVRHAEAEDSDSDTPTLAGDGPEALADDDGDATTTTTTPESEPLITAHSEQPAAQTVHEDEGSAFDLFFLRWSLLLDGVLTTGAAYATEKWHVFLAAYLLPFGSGTAPATKGVITEMCPPSQRADALNALTLVENVARLTTQGLFGFVFAALAEAGKPHLTFYCNAAIALLGMAVLLLSRFPPAGSTLIDEDDDAESGEDTCCEDEVQ